MWYGVPATATSALEGAMKDALPDLFEAAPDLMYSLVTMVSPTNLQVQSPLFTAPSQSQLLPVMHVAIILQVLSALFTTPL